MGFSKISAPSLTQLFVQQIEDLILSGQLAVGEQLPPARELSDRMGVSRPVISAGMVELEQLGFVEIRARQGVFVSDYRRKGTVETLVAIMRYHNGALRQREVRSLLEIRDSLECLTTRLAVELATDEELASLDPILEQLRKAPDEESAADAAFRFHHELSVFSGNVLLPLLYHSFRPQGLYLWSIYCKDHGIASLYALKRKLYDALLARDPHRAAAETHAVMNAAIWDLDRYGA